MVDKPYLHGTEVDVCKSKCMIVIIFFGLKIDIDKRCCAQHANFTAQETIYDR